jgi:3-phenylpropionate/cinnamic acid dioxygenase small subunit
MTFADVSQGVRATLAAYAQALDDGRTDDVVATFCPDGAMDMGSRGVLEGHDALRAAFLKWVPTQSQRHLVVNTHVVEWDDQQATAVSDVVFLLREDGGWAVKLVGRYRDVLHLHEGGWRFHRRTADFSS